jgi:hypothetical protein
MKPWKLLLALACLAFVVSPATASVLFKGLQYGALGSCVVDVGSDGRLHANNIGSSGQDGVSVSCLHSNGMRMQLDGSSTPADAGASVAMRFRCFGAGQPAPRSVELDYVRSPGHTTLFADASQFCSGPRQTVSLSRNGVVVYTCDVPAGTGVDVACDATGACPNPTLSIVFDNHNIQARTGAIGQVKFAVCYTVNGASWLAHVSVAGHDDDCDGISFTCALDDPDEDCDGISCDVSVTAPPGSSFSSLACRSAQCRCLGGFVQAAGGASLSLDPPNSVSGKKLYVGNLPFSSEGGMELVRAPEMCVDGSGGGGGGGGGAAMAVRFAAPSLYFDPATDVGASSRISIVGEGFSPTGSSLGAASGSMTLTVSGNGLVMFPSYSGLQTDQVWVAVMSGGVEVARALLPPGVGVPITPPPGEPLGMAINEKGLCHCKPKPAGTHGPGLKADNPAIESASLSPTRGIAVDIRRPLHIKFQNVRLFTLDGSDQSGDELMCWAECSSGACEGSFRVDVASDLVRCPNPASSLSSLSVLDFPQAGGNPIGPDVAGSTALSSTHTCVTVPMEFTRDDLTPVRGFSVAFHLSPELALCGAGVVEGDYLSSVAGTQMFVHDNGGGSFTVDDGILGPVCGATGDGTLFSLNLASTLQSPGTYGVITVDSVRVRDCSNHVVVADPGAPGYIPIVTTSPAALSGLTAVQVKTGNPAGSTTGIRVSFPALTSVGSSLRLLRKGFGNYPLYDNGSSPGSAPSPPASSLAAEGGGWTRVTCGSSCSTGACTSTCTATSVLDSPPARDYYYYVAFVCDLYGNESAVSNMTPGTLDYHLGDVADGSSLCVGDNHVSLPDLSFLGAHYGRVLTGTPFTCLDVGPTLDYSVDTRPTTDGKADFEDFMMVAINWSVVSAPAAASRPAAAPMNASQLAVPSLPPAGGTFDVGVVVDGAGDVQGMSVRLAYDPSVLEQVGVAPGALIDEQGRPGTVLSSGPGDVDAALLGVGPGLAGHGELARVTFRVKADGDPRLAIASITARDADNHPVAIAGSTAGPAVPARTALGFAYPNPFRESVAIQLSLHRAGPAAIGIYDVAGRRVRTLVRGVQAAGARLVTWDGRDDAGMRLAPGAYIVRLETAELRESRTVRLVR